MAECQGDIVYRKDGNACCSAAVADDNSALVKAYEGALMSFQKGLTSEGEGSGDGVNVKSESGEHREGGEKEKAQHQWAVGSRCRATWSGDGLLYPAALVSVEGERGRVKFDGYGNEEDVELSALQPECSERPLSDKHWVLGSRCRAVWEEDGLVYPAVLVWKKGDRGRVQFEGYGNEQELDLCALLPPEKHLSRAQSLAAAKVQKTGPASSSSSTSSNTEWRNKESTTKKQDPAIVLPPGCAVGGIRDRGSCHRDPGKDQKVQPKSGSLRDRPMGACSPPTPPFNFFPPVPPRICAGVLPSNSPPPPPPPSVWPPRGRPGQGCEALESELSVLSSMLLSWYLCGYHTGCYMTMLQANASCENVDKETHEPNCTHGKYKH
ncbi:hypothetical protein GJAV_G00075750 [Gymnothorax javanicus]|nr:hypothetical protein GJAV_G00075750 [Gymnothorax javanicus]